MAYSLLISRPFLSDGKQDLYCLAPDVSLAVAILAMHNIAKRHEHDGTLLQLVEVQVLGGVWAGGDEWQQDAQGKEADGGSD